LKHPAVLGHKLDDMPLDVDEDTVVASIVEQVGAIVDMLAVKEERQS
jgi:hypothetical protein